MWIRKKKLWFLNYYLSFSASSFCLTQKCHVYAKCNTLTDNCECVAATSDMKNMKKVCGTDGITYKDASVLKYNSCMNNTNAEVKHSGGCSRGLLLFFKTIMLFLFN